MNTNPFIEHYDQALYHEEFITESNEQELLEHILAESDHTDLEDFVKANISYDDAMTVVTADDQFAIDATEYLSNQPNGLCDAITEQLQDSSKSVTDLAYSLAYEHTEFGTKLLDELLYYRSLGRI